MKAQRKNQSATTYNGKQSNHTLRFFFRIYFYFRNSRIKLTVECESSFSMQSWSFKGDQAQTDW